MHKLRATGGERQGGGSAGRANVPRLLFTALLVLTFVGVLILARRPGGGDSVPGSVPSPAEISRWREAARYHAEDTGNVDRAIAALESLTVALPEDAGALIMLGELLSGAPRKWARAAGLFEQAIGLDSLSAEAHAGLIQATARLGDLEGARSARVRFARLRPDHPFPYILACRLSYLAEDRGAVDSAIVDLESAFPEDRTVRAWVAEERARLALVDGRPADADARYREALAVAAVRGDPSEIIERAVDRAWALTWWSADTATAIALVDSTLAAHPMSSMSMADWPFHYIAEFYALAGQSMRAVQVLESHAGHMNPPPDAVPNPWWQAAWGLIALDVSKPREAVERFRLWDEGIGCQVCALGDLARALEAAGNPDSAVIVWERYLEASDPQRIEWDPFYLGIARERLSVLYAAEGREPEATAIRESLARQWSEADPQVLSRMR
jgi:tetratricopeptide (TPR) repeat protein